MTTSNDTRKPAYETDTLMNTEPGRVFLREWRSRFGDPKDWTAANIMNDTSSLLLWLKYVVRASQTDSTLTTVIALLDKIEAENNGPPRFRQFVRRHRRSIGCGSTDVEYHAPRCEACDGTGILFVPTVRRLGRSYLVTEPIVLLPGEELGETSVPCRCTKGQRQNSAGVWQYSEEQLARFMQHAKSAAEWYALRDACLELSGRAVPRPPDDPELSAWMSALLAAHEQSDRTKVRSSARSLSEADYTPDVSERERIDEASLLGVKQ